MVTAATRCEALLRSPRGTTTSSAGGILVTQIKFGTDGWRGIIADDFTFDNVRRVGNAMAIYAKTFCLSCFPDLDSLKKTRKRPSFGHELVTSLSAR
jgi:hypothetical protein